MVTLVKHEWHQTDRQYCLELDEDLLREIYPDMKKREFNNLLKSLENGDADIEEIINDAWENNIDIDWEFQYDDCWTDRKGGYEVTYEYGDEDSYHHEPEPTPPTHKCTKCKWQGASYDADWQHQDADGNDLEEPKKVCPYCESDTELTEYGVQEEQERKERQARWDKEWAEQEEAVPCYSCGAMHKESELPEIKESGYYCPSCNENWVMMDHREATEEENIDLENALQELKDEFDRLLAEENGLVEDLDQEVTPLEDAVAETKPKKKKKN